MIGWEIRRIEDDRIQLLLSDAESGWRSEITFKDVLRLRAMLFDIIAGSYHLPQATIPEIFAREFPEFM